MKRFITVMLAVLFLVSMAWAVSDNFTITVSVEYLDISLKTADGSLDYTNWDIGGPVAAGSQHTMTTGSAGNHILVQNNSNVALDFSAYSSDATTWTPGAAPGSDVYQLEGGKGLVDAEPGSYTTFPGAAAPGAVYASAEPAGIDHHFYARLTVPNPVTDGNTHTITVVIVAQ